MKHPDRLEQQNVPAVVQTALEALRTVPLPDPQTWEAGRQAFLAESREFARQAVPSAPVSRRKDWKGWFKSLPFLNLKEATMATLVKVLVILAVVFGGVVGTVQASQTSLPDSTLYPLKLQLEDWQLATVHDPEVEANLALSMAQRRVDEVVELAARGDAAPEEVATRYRAQVGTALQSSGTLTDSVRLRLHTQISRTLGTHVQQMQQLGSQEGSVQAMIRTGQDGQAQVGGRGYGPGAPQGGQADAEHGYGPGGSDDGEPGGHGPGDGDGEPNADGAGYGPGVGDCDGECDGDGESYGPGGSDDGEPGGPAVGDGDERGGNGPGNGDGNGAPDDNGDSNEHGGNGAGNGPGGGNVNGDD